ncbi:MAG: hypothetical protein Q8K51_06310, partial [Nitrospirota bacterium]|nr:hypothetical protein [Nitrospirota bacterium]
MLKKYQAAPFVLIIFVAVSISSYSHAETKTTDVEGYKGVPWGTELNKFKRLKSYKGVDGTPTDEFLGGSHYVNLFIASILNIPIQMGGYGYEEYDKTNVPKKFSMIQKDDVFYIFYDRKLVMVFSKLSGVNNFEEYYNLLLEKYEKISTVDKHFSPSAIVKRAGMYATCDLYATLFKGGDTLVYLIKQKLNTSGMQMGSLYMQPSSKNYLEILYISNSKFQEIKKDI